MTGVILCGGQSSRMGQDKGTMQLNEQKWAQIVAQNFMQLNIPFVVSVNESQKEMYEQIFSPIQIIIDNSNINVKGPLLALMSVHTHLPTEDLFVLACDMIDMELAPLQYLLNKHLLESNCEAYLFKTDEVQPLCTIYTEKALRKVFNNILNGQLKKYSLKFVLDNLDTNISITPNEWLNYFNNYNSKEDLNNNKQI